MNVNSKNLDYLKSLLGKDSVATFLKVEEKGASSIDEKRKHRTVLNCLKEMEKHEDNPWWLSDSKAVLAENQLKCDVLLIPSKRFAKVLSSTLGRYVSLDEIIFEKKKLSNEFFAKKKMSAKSETSVTG